MSKSISPKDLFVNTLTSGLKRKSLTSGSRWACQYRIMDKPISGPWTFDYHPWLRGMHDSTAELNVGQKAAQMGFTETLLNVCFFSIDVLGVDCLYVLPAKTPDASDFSASRFDPALELSEHLRSIFSDVKNIGHKRAGNANLFIRGSRSRSGLKSLPISRLFLDELEEMDQENIPLALERLSGQFDKQAWMVSTPCIPKSGINKYYLASTQEHFFFKCPGCSRTIELQFPDNIKICGDNPLDPDIHRSHLFCNYCHKVLDHKEKPVFLNKGLWIPTHNDRDARGFHIPQLYSSTITPGQFVSLYFEAQVNPASEQEFWNSKVGKPHTVEGAQLSDEDINNCMGEYKNVDSVDRGFVTMGVDVGKWIHYSISDWRIPENYAPSIDINVQSHKRVLKVGKVRHFEELDNLMRAFGVRACVIDASPERRKALEFSCRFPGKVYACFYARGIQGKQLHIREEQYEISVDRTSWLDMSLGRFRGRSITIPVDVGFEYRQHLKALVRVPRLDDLGNPTASYEKGEDDDHFAHANNYDEIALQIAGVVGSVQRMESPI